MKEIIYDKINMIKKNNNDFGNNLSKASDLIDCFVCFNTRKLWRHRGGLPWSAVDGRGSYDVIRCYHCGNGGWIRCSHNNDIRENNIFLFHQKDDNIDKRIDLLNKIYLEKIKPKEDWERSEKERLEKERLEKERLEKERLEKERLEKERLEKERLEKERLEKERLEKEHLEKERLEKERLEKERLEKEKDSKETMTSNSENIEEKQKQQEEMERQKKEQEEMERQKKEQEEMERQKKEQENEKKEKKIKSFHTRRKSHIEDSESAIWEFCRSNNKSVKIENLKFDLAIDKLAKGIKSSILAYSGDFTELAKIAFNLTLDLKGSQSSLESEYKVVGKTLNEEVVFLKIKMNNIKRGLNMCKCLSFNSSKQVLIAKYTVVKPKNNKAREICNNRINEITINTLDGIFEEDEEQIPDCCGCY